MSAAWVTITERVSCALSFLDRFDRGEIKPAISHNYEVCIAQMLYDPRKEYVPEQQKSHRKPSALEYTAFWLFILASAILLIWASLKYGIRPGEGIEPFTVT
jgi:hypothetical protein